MRIRFPIYAGALPLFAAIDALICNYNLVLHAKASDFHYLRSFLLANLNLVGVWLVIFAAQAALLRVRLTRPIIVAIQFGLMLFGMAALCLSWAFTLYTGNSPSREILLFAWNNGGGLFVYCLHQAPAVAWSVIAAGSALVVTLFLLSQKLVTDVRENPPSFPGRMAIAGAFLIAGTAGFLDYRGSAVAIDNFTLSDWRTSSQVTAAERVLKEQLPRKRVQPPSVSKDRPPVIMVMLESFRHDVATLSGGKSATPFLDSLADESLVFDRAYAPASHSNFSYPAFWYSQYPLRSPETMAKTVDAPWRGTSLFGAMKGAGYQTAYFSSQNEKWDGMVNWMKTPDVDVYVDPDVIAGSATEAKSSGSGSAISAFIRVSRETGGQSHDSDTLRRAANWAMQLPRQQTFMLGLNLQNAHYAYFIPEGGAMPFQPAEFHFGRMYYAWPKSKARVVRNRYLDAVYNVDAELAAFAARLKEAGIWDRCYFIVVGDHGEAFYEHYFANHSGPMYEEVARPIAMIKPPKNTAGFRGRIDFPLSTIDIPSLMLNRLDIPVPDSFQGARTLDEARNRPVFMYSDIIERQYAMVAGRWKLMHTVFPTANLLLFDLKDDPGETRNLYATRPEVAARLSRILDEWRYNQIAYFSDPELYRDRAAPRPKPYPVRSQPRLNRTASSTSADHRN